MKGKIYRVGEGGSRRTPGGGAVIRMARALVVRVRAESFRANRKRIQQ